ncbi:MAG TPA: sulfotransferase [Gammaproteobacteria bacterium]|nr:sulfotransferase [Gammaproteobacteria bacterium]
MADKPIFVVGTPRSGTTLTAKILGRHPQIFMPGETHYFDDVYSRSEQLGNVENYGAITKIAERLHTIYMRYYEAEDQKRIKELFPTSTDLRAALHGCVDYGDVLDRFMGLQMEGTSKSRWGNNAPRDLFSYRDIKNYFPDAKFVVCVRDIRAFLLSYKGKWKVVTGDVYVNRMKKLYHPVVTSYLWKSSMRQVALLMSEVPSSDWVIVRYEDLVAEPEKIMRQVCDAIGEEFEHSMLDVDTHNSSCTDQEKGIFATSVNRWLTELTPEEIAIGQYITKKELSCYGYSNVDVSVKAGRLLWIWIGAPYGLWNALYANRAVRGPLIPYLARRIGALFRKSY